MTREMWQYFENSWKKAQLFLNTLYLHTYIIYHLSYPSYPKPLMLCLFNNRFINNNSEISFLSIYPSLYKYLYMYIYLSAYQSISLSLADHPTIHLGLPALLIKLTQKQTKSPHDKLIFMDSRFLYLIIQSISHFSPN